MKFTISTKGHYDFIDITENIRQTVEKFKISNGIACIFVSGSTAAITTMEFEEGVKKDLINLFEAWAPENADYEHHKRWGDRNGAAHMKSALIGTDLIIPIENGQLQLGTWQQIVVIDFDEKSRERNVIVKIIKE